MYLHPVLIANLASLQTSVCWTETLVRGVMTPPRLRVTRTLALLATSTISLLGSASSSFTEGVRGMTTGLTTLRNA